MKREWKRDRQESNNIKCSSNNNLRSASILSSILGRLSLSISISKLHITRTLTNVRVSKFDSDWWNIFSQRKALNAKLHECKRPDGDYLSGEENFYQLSQSNATFGQTFQQNCNLFLYQRHIHEILPDKPRASLPFIDTRKNPSNLGYQSPISNFSSTLHRGRVKFHVAQSRLLWSLFFVTLLLLPPPTLTNELIGQYMVHIKSKSTVKPEFQNTHGNGKNVLAHRYNITTIYNVSIAHRNQNVWIFLEILVDWRRMPYEINQTRVWKVRLKQINHYHFPFVAIFDTVGCRSLSLNGLKCSEKIRCILTVSNQSKHLDLSLPQRGQYQMRIRLRVDRTNYMNKEKLIGKSKNKHHSYQNYLYSMYRDHHLDERHLKVPYKEDDDRAGQNYVFHTNSTITYLSNKSSGAVIGWRIIIIESPNHLNETSINDSSTNLHLSVNINVYGAKLSHVLNGSKLFRHERLFLLGKVFTGFTPHVIKDIALENAIIITLILFYDANIFYGNLLSQGNSNSLIRLKYLFDPVNIYSHLTNFSKLQEASQASPNYSQSPKTSPKSWPRGGEHSRFRYIDFPLQPRRVQRSLQPIYIAKHLQDKKLETTETRAENLMINSIELSGNHRSLENGNQTNTAHLRGRIKHDTDNGELYRSNLKGDDGSVSVKNQKNSSFIFNQQRKGWLLPNGSKIVEPNKTLKLKRGMIDEICDFREIKLPPRQIPPNDLLNKLRRASLSYCDAFSVTDLLSQEELNFFEAIAGNFTLPLSDQKTRIRNESKTINPIGAIKQMELQMGAHLRSNNMVEHTKVGQSFKTSFGNNRWLIHDIPKAHKNKDVSAKSLDIGLNDMANDDHIFHYSDLLSNLISHFWYRRTRDKRNLNVTQDDQIKSHKINLPKINPSSTNILTSSPIQSIPLRVGSNITIHDNLSTVIPTSGSNGTRNNYSTNFTPNTGITHSQHREDQRFCRTILKRLTRLDTQVRRAVQTYRSVIQKADCHIYSIKWGCADCEEAYKLWLCSTTLPHYAQSINEHPENDALETNSNAKIPGLAKDNDFNHNAKKYQNTNESEKKTNKDNLTIKHKNDKGINVTLLPETNEKFYSGLANKNISHNSQVQFVRRKREEAQPCPDFCDFVLARCPYILPQIEYGGEPTFLCENPYNRKISLKVQDAPCYSICDIKSPTKFLQRKFSGSPDHLKAQQQLPLNITNKLNKTKFVRREYNALNSSLVITDTANFYDYYSFSLSHYCNEERYRRLKLLNQPDHATLISTDDKIQNLEKDEL